MRKLLGLNPFENRVTFELYAIEKSPKISRLRNAFPSFCFGEGAEFVGIEIYSIRYFPRPNVAPFPTWVQVPN